METDGINDLRWLAPEMVAEHECWMRRALSEAEQAWREDEVPVGAVVVYQRQLLAASHNRREQTNDPTAHAEMLAIARAAAARGTWRLDDCTLYVTLEPCVMCAGAIVQARLPWVVYGAFDPKAGAVDSLFRLLGDSRLNHCAQVIGGVLAEPCGRILTRFFQGKRRLGKK